MRPLRTALDLLFPARCLGCEQRGAYFCMACRGAIHPVAAPFCPGCREDVDTTSPSCRCRRPAPLFALAAGEYEGPLRRAVLGLKFQGRTAGAPALAALLYLTVQKLPCNDYLLVPIPLHPDRERERGYNQAALLAREVARLSGRAMAPRLLRRTRATRTQSLLPAAARRRNMDGAFLATGSCSGSIVLLVDDVCTTGATLHAASEAASAAGAKAVYGLVLAATLRGRAGG